SPGVNSSAGPCHGPAGEHAQYDAIVVSPLAPAAIVNSTYVPSSRTSEKALPTPARRPSPRTGRGSARVSHSEPFQNSQAAGSPRPPSGTRATYARETGRDTARPSSPPKTYVQPSSSVRVVPNSTRRDGSATCCWSWTVVTDSRRRPGRESVATSVAAGTP